MTHPKRENRLGHPIRDGLSTGHELISKPATDEDTSSLGQSARVDPDTAGRARFDTRAARLIALVPDATVGVLDGKVPIGAAHPRGFHDFSDDPDRVVALAERHPAANLGWRPPAGIAVFDIDDKPGAFERFDRFAERTTLPPTLAVLTGGGGRHLIYRVPVDVQLFADKACGIDVIRTHGSGYLVGPGSIHTDTRRSYVWEDDTVAIAELSPAAIAELATSRPTRAKAGGPRTTPVDVHVVAQFLDEHGGGRPDTRMRRVLNKLDVRMRAGAHDAMRDAVWQVFALAAKGHPGAQRTIGMITAEFLAEMGRRRRGDLAGARATDDAIAEIQRAILGAVAEFAEVSA